MVARSGIGTNFMDGGNFGGGGLLNPQVLRAMRVRALRCVIFEAIARCI